MSARSFYIGVTFILWGGVFATSGKAQTAPQPVRNPQALAVVQQSLEVMGGVSALAQVQNSIVSGNSVSQVGQQISAGNFTWTYAGNQFRLEDSAANGSHVLVSNGGSPQDFQDGGWAVVPPVTSRTDLAYHIPAIVLFGEFQNSEYSFIYEGSTTVNGKSLIHVQTRDDSDMLGNLFTLQDWYFDPVTSIALRVEFQIPMSQNPSDSVHASIDLSNFQIVSGVLVPLQLNIVEGPTSCIATVSSVVFNTSIDASMFSPTAEVSQ